MKNILLSLRTYRNIIILTGAAFLCFTTAAFAGIISGEFTTGNSNNVTITQLTLLKPQNTGAGDLLLASIAVGGGYPANVTAPSGWSTVLRTDNDTNVSIITYWKIASASEPTSYQWTINSQTHAVGGINRYTGVDQSNPISVSSQAIGRGKTAATASFSTSQPASEIIAVYAYDSGPTNGNHFSTPAGMNEIYDVSNTPFGPSLAYDSTIQADSGPSGVKTSSLGNGSDKNWVAQQIALRPSTASTGIVETFNSYSSGNIVGANGGLGWAGPWTGDAGYDVENNVAYEGGKALHVVLQPGFGGEVARTFAPKASGHVHFSLRKDNDHQKAIFVRLYSGSAFSFYVGISGPTDVCPGWTSNNGHDVFYCAPETYTPGTWDTGDIEFNTNTQEFRISVNGGPYSAWNNFYEPSGPIDTIKVTTSGNDDGTTDAYIDDLRITDN